MTILLEQGYYAREDVMKKLTVILCAVISSFAAVTTLYAVTMKWDIPKDERLEIMRNARIEYLINSTTMKVYDERNIINLSCFQKKVNTSMVKGLFSVYQKEREKDVYALREQYTSEFAIKENGQYIVPDTMYMPNFRHVPTFPVKEVAVDETWESPAEMILNTFSRPLKLSFVAKYTLRKMEKKEGKDIATINYSYVIDKKLIERPYPEDFPLRIVGQNIGEITWNVTDRKPLDSVDRYRIIFLFNNSTSGVMTHEFRMRITTKNKMFLKISKKERDKHRDELRKELPGDVTVETDKRGIVLRLGEVFFDFDSFRLKDTTIDTLNKVSSILKKKYPDRELIIEGHTDTIGDRIYNKKLSENRAHSVAQYLKSKADHDKISYRGLGEERPIDNNSTPEGRQKNRRVEIIIKMN